MLTGWLCIGCQVPELCYIYLARMLTGWLGIRLWSTWVVLYLILPGVDWVLAVKYLNCAIFNSARCWLVDWALDDKYLSCAMFNSAWCWLVDWALDDKYLSCALFFDVYPHHYTQAWSAVKLPIVASVYTLFPSFPCPQTLYDTLYTSNLGLTGGGAASVHV